MEINVRGRGPRREPVLRLCFSVRYAGYVCMLYPVCVPGVSVVPSGCVCRLCCVCRTSVNVHFRHPVFTSVIRCVLPSSGVHFRYPMFTSVTVSFTVIGAGGFTESDTPFSDIDVIVTVAPIFVYTVYLPSPFDITEPCLSCSSMRSM